MPLFSRRPSRETTLQRIYTDAYQSSLQSILKESNLEFESSLASWKATLAHISAGMAFLDGTPPRTGQEKSLLASILDIERQCHDRIAALEVLVQNGSTAVKHNPYGTSAASNSASNVNLSVQSVPRVAVGSRSPEAAKSSAAKSVAARSEPALADSPRELPPVPPPHLGKAPALSTPALIGMPKLKDMGYNLYRRRPNPEPQNSSHSIHTTTSSTHQAGSTSKSASKSGHSSSKTSSSHTSSKNDTKSEKKEEKEPLFKSALDYAQASTAQQMPPARHGMLQTLRKNTPLGTNSNSSKTRQPATKAATAVWSSGSANSLGGSASSSKNSSPVSSAEALETKAHQDLVRKAARLSTSPTIDVGDFNGFDSAYGDGPGSPSLGSEPANIAAKQVSQVQMAPSQLNASGLAPTQQRPSGHGRVNSYQVTYTKVQTGSRSYYRPKVMKVEHANNHRSQHQSHPHSQSHSQSQSSQQQQQSTSQNTQGSERERRKEKVLADDELSGEERTDENEELDEWDKMARKKIKELRGVDEKAAHQILQEVVLKGDPVHWDDIAGLDKAKTSLKETVVYPFLRPDLFSGLREPALGMLLFGPPGTGKTMLARAVATESKSTFFSISASSLTSKYMGESEKLVRALFQLAKALAPSIIFIDEIDSILTQRADSGEHEASRRIKNEFLVQWSDLQAAAAGKASSDSVSRVLVLGATNLPWAIDEAARRRFVRRQYIPLPEAFTRKVHIEKLLSHQKHALSEWEIDNLVRDTDGYSGSDITALAKDAAMGPLRSLGDALLTTAPDQVPPMQFRDFSDSMRSIRPSVSPEGLRAYENWAKLYGSSGA